MSVLCPESEPGFTTPTINGCGQTITWPHTFTFSNPNPDPNQSCRIDLRINGVDQGPSLDPGILTWPTITNGPTGQIIVEIFCIYPDGSIELVDSCTMLVPFNYKLSGNFDTDVPLGQVTEAQFEAFFTDSSGATSIPFGVETLENVEIVNGCMRVRFGPNDTIGEVGSTRTIFNGNLPPSPCYCAEHTIELIGPNFDYGGDPGQQTIKMGFGLGGGSDVTGGGGYDPCGWTFRWGTRGDEFIGYSYAFGRPQVDQFGQDIPTGVVANPDQKYDLKMKVCMNTDGNADGSYELYIDGVLVASDYAVLWMDHTQCPTATENVIDSLIYTSFYGGTNFINNQGEEVLWSPTDPQFIEFCNPCYTATDT